MTDLNLKVLLENIRLEAVRLQREGLDIDSAYQQAITQVIKVTAEAQDISPFEARILSEMERVAADTRLPVSTTRLQVELGIDSRFAMYNHLRDLERKGLVAKAGGRYSKRGWLLAA